MRTAMQTEKNTHSLDQKKMATTEPEISMESPIIATGTNGDLAKKHV